MACPYSVCVCECVCVLCMCVCADIQLFCVFDGCNLIVYGGLVPLGSVI